jgi:probable rRNA maturation factor
MGDDQAPALRVGVVDAHGRAVRAPGLGRWLARVAPRRARGSVTIALVSDARIRVLNRQYRGKDYATDVLSFPAAAHLDDAAGFPAPGSRLPASGRVGTSRTTRRAPGAPHRPHLAHAAHRAHATVHLGDIIIARGVAARQAREQGHAPGEELKVLALHGLLHLLGYDHEIDNGRMRRVEARLRRQGGLQGGLIERGGVR